MQAAWHSLRAVWRIMRMIVHGLHGLWLVWMRFPQLTPDQRHARIQWWSLKTLRVLGLELQLHGQIRPGATLIVANHVSWLDIMAVHAACPHARFVSKAQVHHWPLIGRLVDAAGTLYIERERARDAMRVVHLMAEALSQGQTVAVFPEGTTADGHQLLPFHANLLQAAVATATPIQPVALRFSDAKAPVSEAAQFLGETTLAQSLWRIAKGQGMVVTLRFLTSRATAHADRRALAQRLRQDIEDALTDLPVS